MLKYPNVNPVNQWITEFENDWRESSDPYAYRDLPQLRIHQNACNLPGPTLERFGDSFPFNILTTDPFASRPPWMPRIHRLHAMLPLGYVVMIESTRIGSCSSNISRNLYTINDNDTNA